MKFFRLFFLLTLGLTLLAAATQALARSADLVPPAQATTTPSAQAPTISDKMATLQAKQKKGKPAHFIGTVAAFDSAGLTLTLRDGSSVTLLLGENTRIFVIGSEGGLPRPANLAIGQLVMARAIRDTNDVLTARVILVTPSQPVRVHLIGTVTAYAPGASITIQALDGKSYTLAITRKTSILPPELAASLAVGSRVTILAPREPLGGQMIALGIAVLP